MTDKKPNMIERILCVLKQKKENSDIITQADKVIEGYIESKNKIIHRRYPHARRLTSPVCIAALISGSALCIMILKSIIL